MAILPLNIARVSTVLQSNTALQSIQANEAQLLDAENQLSTGKRINQPSDDPGGAAVAEQLTKTLQNRQAYADNISSANSQLSTVDTSLGDLTNLLQQAQTVASQNVSSTVTADERTSAASVIDSLYNQALSIGNTESNGSYLFAGDNNTTAPFVESDGGVKFIGSTQLLQNQVDESSTMSFQVDGNAVFGALSTRVTGTADLTPSLSTDTRIADLNGTSGNGVTLGPIQISNGTTTKLVDLSKADTIGDVVSLINAAGVGGITASFTGKSITLSGSATDNITVTDVGSGSTATDLGINTGTAGAGTGTPVTGSSVQPKLTALTPLADLKGGAGIDLTSGITITNGTKSATLTFGSPPLPANPTVQDLLNEINGSSTDVQAQINSTGTGLDIINPTQGATLTISENGGTTAEDLGVRSFSAATQLSQLNDGKGVGTAQDGGNDFTITDSAGNSFSVKVAGLGTVQDVLNAINSAATSAGAGVTASFATSGNALVLTDTAAGTGTLTLTPDDASTAAADLGLTAPASGNVITGTDVNGVSADGIFGDLDKLRTALRANDQAGITAAATALQNDYSQVVQVRGANGAKIQELTTRQSDLTSENTTTQTMLSNIVDVDYTSAVTQFQQVQTALQASLEASAKVLGMSLMDYLD